MLGYTYFCYSCLMNRFEFDNLHFPYPTFCRVGESSLKRGFGLRKKLFDPPFLPVQAKGKYRNYHHVAGFYEKHPEWFFPSIRMYLRGHFYRERTDPNLDAWVELYHGYERSKAPIITWLGHATILIQIENLNILIDPIIETPSRFYERILPFGVEPEKLPPIDLVLLSHNHRDHMDTKTLKFLHERDKPLFLVPEGNGVWFFRRGIETVEEFTWWQTWRQAGVEFTFVPAWHWSQRGLFDHNKTLWGGWVVQGGQDTIYFVGDTAYCQYYFESVGKQFPSIDVAILPIGPCEPDQLMRRSHMNAQQAGQAFLDCSAQYFIPMHWGTFYFGLDTFEKPAELLNQWWEENEESLAGRSLFLCRVGQQLHLEHHKNACSDKPDQSR